jgi:hypothetical protein
VIHLLRCCRCWRGRRSRLLHLPPLRSPLPSATGRFPSAGGTAGVLTSSLPPPRWPGGSGGCMGEAEVVPLAAHREALRH